TLRRPPSSTPFPYTTLFRSWQHIDRATWRDDVLTVIEADVVDDLLLVDRPPVAARLARPRDLPPTVRKRVEGNIVKTELATVPRSEEHTSELQSRSDLVCRL